MAVRMQLPNLLILVVVALLAITIPSGFARPVGINDEEASSSPYIHSVQKSSSPQRTEPVNPDSVQKGLQLQSGPIPVPVTSDSDPNGLQLQSDSVPVNSDSDPKSLQFQSYPVPVTSDSVPQSSSAFSDIFPDIFTVPENIPFPPDSETLILSDLSRVPKAPLNLHNVVSASHSVPKSSSVASQAEPDLDSSIANP